MTENVIQFKTKKDVEESKKLTAESLKEELSKFIDEYLVTKSKDEKSNELNLEFGISFWITNDGDMYADFISGDSIDNTKLIGLLELLKISIINDSK